MGLRFRKSVKIAPGVKLNFGKKSMGISVGNKFGGVSVNSRSGIHRRVSIPGTGISYTEKVYSCDRHKEGKERGASSYTTPLDKNALEALSDDAFLKYANGYIEYAESLSEETSEEVITEAKNQLELINFEFKKRGQSYKSGKKPSFPLLITGVILSVLGLAGLLWSWIGLIILAIGLGFLLLELKK